MKRIALFIACLIALSSVFAVAASASGSAYVSGSYEAKSEIPVETDWRDNPQDTNHCCDLVDYPSSYPSWINDPYDTGHCTVVELPTMIADESLVTEPSEYDTSHCEVEPPTQPHHYSDIEGETCYCGEHHPLPKPTCPTEPASAQAEPSEAEDLIAPTAPEAKPDPLKKYNTYLYERMGEQVEVTLFEKLGGDCYITHYTQGAFDPATLTKCVDKYVYIADGSDKSVFIYDAKNDRQYELYTAYEDGLISKRSLNKAFEILAENPSTAMLKVNTCVLTAGKQARELDAYRSGKGFFIDCDDAVGKIKNSDPTVAKLLSDKSGVYLVGLRKGTTILSRKLKGGREISCKVTVKSNPKLSKTSLTVRKGKTATVSIYGKAKPVDNKYTSTSKARIISVENADKIKIRGLKRGETTLKVKVNGVSLKLKVKVK